ncbi:MAG: DNA polymerase III subunit beta [bacterium]
MKLKILQENLSKALTVVSRSVASKSSIPILTNFLITAKKSVLEIYGTDFDIASRIYVGADVEEEGRFCVSAKNLTDLISLLPSGTIEIYTEKENLIVVSPKGRTVFPTSIADDYPETFVLKKEDTPIMSFPVSSFYQIVDKTSFSTDKQKLRPIFTGVYFDFMANGLNTVATDGMRLSRYFIEGEQPKNDNMSIPSDALDELVKTIHDLGEVPEDKIDIYMSNNQAIFKYKNAELAARLIEGIFPDYKAVIPSEFKFVVKVMKAEILQALRITGVFTRNLSVPKVGLNFDFTTSKIHFIAEASEIGQNNTEIEMDIEQSTDEIKTMFNAKNIQDALAHIGTETIIIRGFENKRNPGAIGIVLMEDNNDKFLHMMTPFAV